VTAVSDDEVLNLNARFEGFFIFGRTPFVWFDTDVPGAFMPAGVFFCFLVLGIGPAVGPQGVPNGNSKRIKEIDE
jgi:hypothetical protein